MNPHLFNAINHPNFHHLSQHIVKHQTLFDLL